MRPTNATPMIVQMPDVEMHVVDGDVFLVCDRSATIHHPDPMSAVIWGQFGEPESVENILALLCDAFPDHDSAILAKDLNKVVDTFLELQLVRRV